MSFTNFATVRIWFRFYINATSIVIFGLFTIRILPLEFFILFFIIEADILYTQRTAMTPTSIEEMKTKVLSIIGKFPISKNWHPYLTIRDGSKLFFKVFIDKYWINWCKCVYKPDDIRRRIRLVEFFDYFIKDYDMIPWGGNKMMIESNFHRMVIAKVGKEWKQRLELISFYPI